MNVAARQDRDQSAALDLRDKKIRGGNFHGLQRVVEMSLWIFLGL